jgi:hypothetical protein
MSPAPIGPEQLAPLPLEVGAAVEAIVQQDERRLAEYEARSARLTATLGAARKELGAANKSPRNSSLPSSR